MGRTMTGGFERILLTGGAGFIGSHLAEALVRQGAKVSIIDNFDPFYEAQWKRANLAEIERAGDFSFHQEDIRQEAAMRRVFSSARPEAVIHLAARPGVRPSIEQPRLYEQVNVGGTVNLLELAREFHVRQFVFASSSSVYGATARRPFSEEDSDLRPISPYGATKLAAETLCRTHASLHSLPVVCLRFFSVYGPRQRPDLAIHKFTALIEAGQPVPFFGDGTASRDYTHIDDIVAGVLAALNYAPRRPAGCAPFDVLNLGNAHPVTLGALVGLLEKATGKVVRRDPHPFPPGDVPLTWADTRKAEELLDYRPAKCFEEGLREFVCWFHTRRASRGAAA